MTTPTRRCHDFTHLTCSPTRVPATLARPALLGRPAVSRRIPTPRFRADSAPTPTFRSCDRRCNTPTPTTRSLGRARLAPTSPTRCRGARVPPARAPCALGGLLRMSAFTGSGHFSCLLNFRLAGDYGADAPAERDGPLGFEFSWISLTDADVPIGDIRLAVLVPVGFGPRFGLALRPDVAIEEERLHRHRSTSRDSGLSVGRRETPTRRDPRVRFTKVGKSVVVKSHAT